MQFSSILEKICFTHATDNSNKLSTLAAHDKASAPADGGKQTRVISFRQQKPKNYPNQMELQG